MAQVISVVIPLFNKALYIERAIKSVLEQTIPPFEIIVVDDGSTDGGGELVARFDDPRLRLITQENQGVSAARNRGIKEAAGELIAFLDADDAWKPNFLSTILCLRKKFPQAGAYATAYERVTPHGIHYYPSFKILDNDEKEGIIKNYFKSALCCPISSSSVVIPKNILKEIGGFVENQNWAEDVDLWLKIALRYPIAWSSECGAIYYQNAENRSDQVRWRAEEPSISRAARYAIESGLIAKEDIAYLNEYVSRFQLEAARRCLIMGEKEKALEMLFYAKDTKILQRKWRRLFFFAKLPGNPELWLYKTTIVLKKFFPQLLYLKNKILLRNYLQNPQGN